MDRKDIVLAGLSPANGAFHSPVQIQKLFFLIDKNIHEEVQGSHFDFQPYNYGPFDKAVYDVLEELQWQGLVEIAMSHTWKEYRLTDSGQIAGEQLLKNLSSVAKEYIEQASEFVRRLTFSELVTSIYRAYPEMRSNSVFQE